MFGPIFDPNNLNPLTSNEKKFKHFLDFSQIGAGLLSLPTEERFREGNDYVGLWEDAFLFTGFEGGKYSFLTNCIAGIIARHGFDVQTIDDTFPEYAQPQIGSNNVICRVIWNGQSCIPDNDVKGEKVRVGITEPRLYLPEVVIKLLDDEFGYEKEFQDTETVQILATLIE